MDHLPATYEEAFPPPRRDLAAEIDLTIRARLEEAAERRTGHDVLLTALGTIIHHCRRDRPVQDREHELRTIAAVAENAVLAAGAADRVAARQEKARRERMAG